MELSYTNSYGFDLEETAVTPQRDNTIPQNRGMLLFEYLVFMTGPVSYFPTWVIHSKIHIISVDRLQIDLNYVELVNCKYSTFMKPQWTIITCSSANLGGLEMSEYLSTAVNLNRGHESGLSTRNNSCCGLSFFSMYLLHRIWWLDTPWKVEP